MSTSQQLTPPAIGERWLGQGGIYAGIVPARAGQKACHLILGDDIGCFEWGPYGEDSPAASRTNGDANTQALVKAEEDYPAAQAAFDHEADGHKDFYLPAAAELYEASLNLGLAPLGWVWSSSQYSAYLAYIMVFDVGHLGYDVKDCERLVRPVRRLLIQ